MESSSSDSNIIENTIRVIISQCTLYCCHGNSLYRKYYPKINPFLGIHYFKMAKLINQTKEDTPSLKESISLLDKVSVTTM